jgi:hypothetical protein
VNCERRYSPALATDAGKTSTVKIADALGLSRGATSPVSPSLTRLPASVGRAAADVSVSENFVCENGLSQTRAVLANPIRLPRRRS